MWETSCSPLADPPPDYGLTACSPADGTVPPWSPDMSGRVVRSVTVDAVARARRASRSRSTRRRARAWLSDGSALISFETPDDEVQALDIPLAGR